MIGVCFEVAYPGTLVESRVLMLDKRAGVGLHDCRAAPGARYSGTRSEEALPRYMLSSSTKLASESREALICKTSASTRSRPGFRLDNRHRFAIGTRFYALSMPWLDVLRSSISNMASEDRICSTSKPFQGLEASLSIRKNRDLSSCIERFKELFLSMWGVRDKGAETRC